VGSRAAFIGSIGALLCTAPAVHAATYTVTGTGDAAGICDRSNNCPSLRAALAAANAAPETDLINVPAGVINIGSDLVVSTQVQIAGASARTTIIDGNAKARGFRVTDAGVLQLGNVTVRNGVSGGGDQVDGGGIYNAGAMQLVNVRVTGNRTQDGGRGGGIANFRGYVVMDNVLVDNNTADNGGGGIQNVGGPETPDRGWITATDTTIFKNTSGLGGVGGLASTANSAIVGLTRVTIADNVAGARGIGGILPSGTTQLIGSIVARNLAAGVTVNCGAGKPTDGNFNVEDDTDCALAPGRMKPGLATALTNEGGQVDVLAIAQSGDAFNRMPLGDTPCEGTDQRGTSRPESAGCDAGAFELVVAPFVTVTGGPNETVTANSVQFDFRADRSGVTVQCDLAGPGQTAGYEPCYKENAQPYGPLADGPYTFSVRAVNGLYPNTTPTTRTFIVNTAPPVTSITSGPDGLTNDNTPTFDLGSSEAGSTFECAVDNATTFATCTSPHTTAPLSDGAHTFRVRARDAAGVVGNTVARAITVDTTAPAGAVTGGPDGATTDVNPAFAFTASETTTECRLAGPGGPGSYEPCASPKAFSALAPGAYEFFVRVTDPAGNQTETRRAFTVAQPQGAQPTPTPTPTPQPTPVPNQTIVVAPATGTVLVKLKGQRTFAPLDVTKGIPNGSEVDVRKGRVTLTSVPRAGAPPETADFYGGIFVVNQKGGITDLKLSERLTGCPKGQRARASVAQKRKVTKRRLWGNGKGSFRTTGRHSSATVRGTVWLVEDTCTTTLTRVRQGVVQVNDFVKKRKTLVKKGKRYTARAKRR
jgi:hypothetical protein